MRTPSSILADLLAADPARPRLTFYDDAPGSTRGERIELSAKVMANWVAKAGNALQDEFDVSSGNVVSLSLPPRHWRTVYWAMAIWSVGATIQLDTDAGSTLEAEPGDTADLLITDDPEATTSADLVVVTMAALARAHPNPLPPGSMDEARELSTYGDRLTPEADPAEADLALVANGAQTTYGSLVVAPDWPPGARVNVGRRDGGQVLQDVLSAWALDGSVVLVRQPDPALMPARLAAEGVTVDLSTR